MLQGTITLNPTATSIRVDDDRLSVSSKEGGTTWIVTSNSPGLVLEGKPSENGTGIFNRSELTLYLRGNSNCTIKLASEATQSFGNNEKVEIYYMDGEA